MFIEWDVSSLSTARSTTDAAYGFYFGTKHGQAGYWVKVPDSAPCIGNITLTGVAGHDPAGLAFIVMYSTIPVVRATARTITYFEKGGRWINLGTSTPGVAMAAGVHAKRIRLYYSAVNEPVGPTA